MDLLQQYGCDTWHFLCLVVYTERMDFRTMTYRAKRLAVQPVPLLGLHMGQSAWARHCSLPQVHRTFVDVFVARSLQITRLAAFRVI